MKYRSLLLLMSIMLSLNILGQEDRVAKVACIGNSITYGSGIKDRINDAYPAQLGKKLGTAYDTRNFGFSGRTLLQKADYPYMAETMFFEAVNWKPDIVIIMLGTNDSKPYNWKYKDDFESDYSKMITAFDTLTSHPIIYLVAPVPVFKECCAISNAVVKNEIYPLVKDIAKKKGLRFIDLYYPLTEMGEMFPDGVHPNAEGSGVMARIIYKQIIEK